MNLLLPMIYKIFIATVPGKDTKYKVNPYLCFIGQKYIKFWLCFFVKKTSKGRSEINWPLPNSFVFVVLRILFWDSIFFRPKCQGNRGEEDYFEDISCPYPVHFTHGTHPQRNLCSMDGNIENCSWTRNARYILFIFDTKVFFRKFFFFDILKFIYFEKATKFCEIFTLLLTGTT